MSLLGRIFGTKFKVGDLVHIVGCGPWAAARLVNGRWEKVGGMRFEGFLFEADTFGEAAIVVENDPSKMPDKVTHSMDGVLVVFCRDRTLFCHSKGLRKVKSA